MRTNSIVWKKNTLIKIGAGGILLLLLVLCAPTTGAYQSFVRSLWNQGHQTLVYHLNQADPVLAMTVGNYYFGGGAYDLEKAAHSYHLALKLEPGIFWGHYQLARVYFVQGDFARATSEINAELAANPTNLRALYVRGLIEMSQGGPGSLSLAEADFTRFVAWAPKEWGGYNDLSFVLAKEGKDAESEATVQQAFTAVPDAKDIPWLWNSLGLAQLNELHYTQAQVSFTKALALAQKITPVEWHRAYSGNDPSGITASIAIFQVAIASNLKTSQADQTI